MTSQTVMKFGFRIRTRGGLIIDKLFIHGRDESDAERKLRQMYQHCKVLQCTPQEPKRSLAHDGAR